MFPPQVWGGREAKCWGGRCFFCLFGCLEGNVPPKIERVGGTLISLHRWGGHVGGTDFRLGGIFLGFVPPNWGGKEELCRTVQTPDLLRTTRFIRFDSLVLNGSLDFFSSSPLTQIGSTGTNEAFQSWNCNLKPFDTMLIGFYH